MYFFVPCLLRDSENEELRNASFRASHQQRKWSVGVLHELLLCVYDISLKIVT